MKAATMQKIRRYHYYLGVFFAPAIILFSLSGILQTYRLQDQPGAAGWIKFVASVHKDQRLPYEKPKKPAPPAGAAAAAKPAPAAPEKKPFTLPLKVFVTLMSIGLILSALTGVAIALNSRVTRRASIWMLVAGSVVPLLFLLLL